MSRPAFPALIVLVLAACGPDDKDTDPAPDSGDTAGVDTSDSGDTYDSVESGNAAPTAPEVVIAPAHPSDEDALTVTIVNPATDPEGDALTYTYAWTRDGAAVSDATGESVGADQTADGQVWAVAVTAFDGQLQGPPGTATVTIGNAAPTAPVVHIDPVAPVKGDDLTLVFDTPATDPDGDTVSQTIHWSIDDAANPSFDDATSIPGVYVDPGEVWVAQISVTDGAHDPVVVSASVTVADSAPVLSSVTLSPTAPDDADPLTVRARASDPDGDPVTYSYRWYRDGVEATDVGDTTTVPDSATGVGEEWFVEATASDGYLTDTMASASVVIAEPTRIRYAWRASLLLTPDAAGGWASATGTANVYLSTTGAMYGVNECDVWWVLATTGVRACRGCDFSFDTQYSYDAASSTIGTPATCAGLEADSAGYLEYMRGQLTVEIDDPVLAVYYYGYPYSVADYIEMYAQYGTYGYSYGGSSTYNSLTSYEDGYGYRHMDMYVMRYIVK